LGTNTRYSPPVREWDPPWPPVQVTDCEWVVIRNYADMPAAVIRRFDATASHGTYFRVVTWRPTSAGRELIGRYESLKDADRAVPFSTVNSHSATEPPELMWAHQRTVQGR
jgi:hypothetical protein